MPRDSNGNYTWPLGTIVTNGETISPSQHNPIVTDYANGLTDSLSRSGSGGMLASLSMGAFKITNLADGTNPADAVNYRQLRSLRNFATATYSIYTDLTANIPADNTIPQVSEGTEIMSVSLAPSSAAAEIEIEVDSIWGVHMTSTNLVTAALFIDGGANAVAAVGVNPSDADFAFSMPTLSFVHTPGDTNVHTYSVRVGTSAGTIRLNGTGAGRMYGGVSAARIRGREAA